MDAPLLGLLADTVTLEAYASQNQYGETTYSAATTHACHISGKVQTVTDQAGNERVSRVQVYLGSAAGVTVRDRVTLPTRFSPTQPVILAVRHYADEVGAYSETLYC